MHNKQLMTVKIDNLMCGESMFIYKNLLFLSQVF